MSELRNGRDVGLYGAAGQRSIEVGGGWQEIQIAIRNTLVLMGVELVGVALMVVISLIAGPWGLVFMLPAGLLKVIHWLEPKHEVSRYTLFFWGVLVFVVLVFVPDMGMFWWPWLWQSSRVDLWGLLRPARFPALIRAWIVFRAALATGMALAWRQVYYLTQRLRSEIVWPTRSHITFKQADVESLNIKGVDNPFEVFDDDEIVEVEAKQVTVIHDVPNVGEIQQLGQGVLVGGGNGGRRVEQWPTEWFAGESTDEKLEQQYQFSRFVLHDPETRYSRNRCVHFFESQIRARMFFDWMRERHYATRVNRTTQALTTTGLWVLEHIVENWEGVEV